jgi:hypothetical protein
MATLLDEILEEINKAGTGGSCKTHGSGCRCIDCNQKKNQSPSKHKFWKERRNDRLNRKEKRK